MLKLEGIALVERDKEGYLFVLTTDGARLVIPPEINNADRPAVDEWIAAGGKVKER